MKKIVIDSYPELINPVIDELKKIEIKEYDSRNEIYTLIKKILLMYGYISGNEEMICVNTKPGSMYSTHNYNNLLFEEHKDDKVKIICSVSFYARYNVESLKVEFLGFDEILF